MGVITLAWISCLLQKSVVFPIPHTQSIIECCLCRYCFGFNSFHLVKHIRTHNSNVSTASSSPPPCPACYPYIHHINPYNSGEIRFADLWLVLFGTVNIFSVSLSIGNLTQYKSPTKRVIVINVFIVSDILASICPRILTTTAFTVLCYPSIHKQLRLVGLFRWFCVCVLVLYLFSDCHRMLDDLELESIISISNHNLFIALPIHQK